MGIAPDLGHESSSVNYEDLQQLKTEVLASFLNPQLLHMCEQAQEWYHKSMV